VVIHPTSNFMGHYLIGPLQQRGRAILALNTRYVANDTALIMEREIQDLGAGIRFLRQRGYERIALSRAAGWRWRQVRRPRRAELCELGHISCRMCKTKVCRAVP
jgi:hypothetical protein